MLRETLYPAHGKEVPQACHNTLIPDGSSRYVSEGTAFPSTESEPGPEGQVGGRILLPSKGVVASRGSSGHTRSVTVTA